MSTGVNGEAETQRAVAVPVPTSNGAFLIIPPEAQLT